jgi:hypothetical protein
MMDVHWAGCISISNQFLYYAGKRTGTEDRQLTEGYLPTLYFALRADSDFWRGVKLVGHSDNLDSTPLMQYNSEDLR